MFPKFTWIQILSITRDGLRISLKFKRIDQFQICLILESKFADNSLSNFWQFKQIQGNLTTWRKKWNKQKNILLDATHLN